MKSPARGLWEEVARETGGPIFNWGRRVPRQMNHAVMNSLAGWETER